MNFLQDLYSMTERSLKQVNEIQTNLEQEIASTNDTKLIRENKKTILEAIKLRTKIINLQKQIRGFRTC